MQKQRDVIPNPYHSYPKVSHFRKGFSQVEIAEQLGISKSYLSMILSGQRKCPEDLMERLQAIPGVHKSVNLQSCIVPSKQRVEGSNPSRDSMTTLFWRIGNEPEV